MKKKETVLDCRLLEEKEQVLERLINDFGEEFTLIKFNSRATWNSGLLIHSVLFNVSGTDEVTERIFLTNRNFGLLVPITNEDVSIINEVLEETEKDKERINLKAQ